MHTTKAFFRYMRTLEHTHAANAEATFARAFGLQLRDLSVLRFFAQGLSRAHRLKLLQRVDDARDRGEA